MYGQLAGRRGTEGSVVSGLEIVVDGGYLNRSGGGITLEDEVVGSVECVLLICLGVGVEVAEGTVESVEGHGETIDGLAVADHCLVAVVGYYLHGQPRCLLVGGRGEGREDEQ